MSRESDDFVARLVKDPNDPPKVTLLSGYIGASSEEGHVRLYLDEELSRYIEIPKEAIRHAQALPPEQSPLGGSLIWIDRDADVMHGKAGEEPGVASFLKGWIADEYTEVTAAFGGGAGARHPGARGVGPQGGMYPSVPCITPLISRRIPCRPQPDNPFIRQHYQDFLNRPPATGFWCNETQACWGTRVCPPGEGGGGARAAADAVAVPVSQPQPCAQTALCNSVLVVCPSQPGPCWTPDCPASVQGPCDSKWVVCVTQAAPCWTHNCPQSACVPCESRWTACVTRAPCRTRV